MNLSEFCIRRPVFTILLMAAICVGGIAGYRTLAVAALPSVDFPTIQVSANLPGASPETMASSVATPLERQFSTIAGISSMTSTSYLGVTQITLQFDLDRNIDGAALDVQTAISATMRRLPQEMPTPPSFRKVNPADQPIFFISISSDSLPISQINEYADTMMAQRISTLPGVAQVQIYGSQKYAVRVQLDPDKLAAQGLSFDDIKTALAGSASNAPMGVISGSKQLYNIMVTGQPSNADQFRELVAVWKNGAPVRLKDLGTVTDDVEDNRTTAFINGKKGLTLAIQRQPDANTIKVVESVRELLPVFRSQLPAAVEMTPMFDRSVSIRHSVDDVQFTLFLTIALVIAVIFCFLRHLRATLIPALAVPLSIVATYGGMALMGFSINNVSLMAITLSVGFVVDDSIVMLENIIRYIEKGMRPFEAALKGAKEIGFTIMSITLSLVAVFIPVLFMGGLIGRIFHEFAVTISISILVSAFVSLTLAPMMAARFLKGHGEEKESAFGLKMEHWFNRMLGAYDRTLQWTLARQPLMLSLTLATLAASIAMFIYAPKGFFPLEDTGFVFARSEAAQDISFDAMLAKQKQIVEIIRADPAVDRALFALGGGRGALNSGTIFFGMKARSERDSVFVVMQRLRKELAKVEGISVFMQPMQNIQLGGRPSKALYQYTLQGDNLNALYGASEKLLAAMNDNRLFQDASSDLQLKSLQVLVNVDQAKAASYGLTFESIRQGLYNAYGNAQVATLYMPSNDYPVIMEVALSAQQTPEDMAKIYLRGTGGALVPLPSVATISRALAPLSINHQGQLPAVTISFNLAPGVALSQAVSAIEDAQKKIEMPASIITSFQGSAQAFQDSAKGQGALILLSIIVIYIILGMLYESFIHPITILSGLPSAGIGAILCLLLFKMDLNVIAIVGIILLIGIVKKNAIMMVDFAITARQEGKSAHDAIYEACLLRFRPIMMTTMAALFGTLPIALGIGAGSEFRQPLGVAVVGGLLISQVLTLYITPAVYLYLEKFSRKSAAQAA